MTPQYPSGLLPPLLKVQISLQRVTRPAICKVIQWREVFRRWGKVGSKLQLVSQLGADAHVMKCVGVLNQIVPFELRR